MRYEYLLTYEDYNQANRLHRRHNLGAALRFYLLCCVFPIVCSLSFIGLYIIAKQPFYLLVAPIGFIPSAVYVFRIRKYWKALIPRTLPGSLDTKIPITLEWNNEQLIFSIPGQSEGRYFWPALYKSLENEKVVLLYLNKIRPLMIPKNALPPEAWSEIRSRITQHNQIQKLS